VKRSPTSILRRAARAFLLLLAAASLGGCSRSEDDRFPPYDNTAVVEAYYKSKPDFFLWKTPEDIPGDLKWQNGADLPEFGDPNAKKGGTFHDYIPSFPPTFRFIGPDGNNTFRGEHHDHVYVWLVTRHRDADGWIPGVAEEWAVSPDKKTIYFHIDPKATFSDGTPITVDDFFMTFYIMQSPFLQDPFYNDYFTTEFTSITKYDEHIFSVTIPKAKPDPLWTVGDLYPMSRKFYREFGQDFPARYQWRKAPTTGAYDILPENVNRGRSVTLSRVKDWWARDKKHYRYRYNVDFIEYRVTASQDKAFEMFRQGKLDYFIGGLPRYWYDKTEIPEVHKGYIERHMFFYEFPQPTWGIRLNENKPPLDNLDVRIGINYALNFQKVIEVDWRGDKSRMNSMDAGYGRFTNPELRARPFDPVKAREHFAKAGFTKSGPDGILMNDGGKRLSFTLTTFNSGPLTPIMLRLKEEAKKAGLEIIVEGLDTAQMYKKIKQKNHEMSFSGFGAQPPYPDPWQSYHSANAFKTGPDGKREVVVNTNNITMTADPELDKLIDEQRFAPTEEEVQRLSWQISKMLADRASSIPAWESPFYRYLCWRWVKWPKNGNAKNSQLPLDEQMFWIDEDVKRETQKAIEDGTDFGETLRVFDKYRRN
jgi:microcin C transport system substrate-binding protein